MLQSFPLSFVSKGSSSFFISASSTSIVSVRLESPFSGLAKEKTSHPPKQGSFGAAIFFFLFLLLVSHAVKNASVFSEEWEHLHINLIVCVHAKLLNSQQTSHSY